MQPPSNSIRSYLTPFKPLTLHEINGTRPLDSETRAAYQEKNLATILVLIEKKDYQAALMLCLDERMQDSYLMFDSLELILRKSKHKHTQLIALCHDAAEWGSPTGEYAIGYIHHFGLGVDVNLVKTFESYKNAYYKGLIVAGFRLGMMYASGNMIVARDQRLAAAYFEKAEEAGISWAASHLVCAYAALGESKKIYDCCMNWVKQEKPWAYHGLGVLYMNGSGVDCDYIKARIYFEIAQAKTGKTTEEFLASMYKKGFALIDTPEIQKAYIKVGGELGLSSCVLHYNMGMSYLSGFGVSKKSHTNARKLLKIAHTQGHPEAAFQLAESFRKASFMSGRRDESQAGQWYAIAAKKGAIQDEAKQILKKYYPTYLPNDDSGL